MREQEAGGHDPAMTQGTWQKEHGFESQILDLNLSLNPVCSFLAVSFRFSICDGGQGYPGFCGICETTRGSGQNGGLGTKLVLLPGWLSCPGWSQVTCPHLRILGLAWGGNVDSPPKQKSFPPASWHWIILLHSPPWAVHVPHGVSHLP